MDSESNDADVVAQFAWIPEMMLLSLLKRDVTIELRYFSLFALFRGGAKVQDTNRPYLQDRHSTTS